MSAEPSFTVRDGVRIAWRSTGAGDAPAIVLLHSLGASGAMWQPQIDVLAATHRVLTIDTRGHGRSGAPRGPYRLDDLGADVLAVLDDARIERGAVAGISLGGQMAMWLAVHAPDRVSHVVAANTAARLGTEEGWRARIDAVTTGGMTAVRDAVLVRWFAPGFAEARPAWWAEIGAAFLAVDPAGYAGCCAALRDADLRDDVGAITAPTLVIGGELDLPTPPSDAQWLHEHIPGSRLVVLPGAAHLSNLDRPEAFTELVAEHVQR